MSRQTERDTLVEETWRSYMMTGRVPPGLGQPWYDRPFFRRLMRHLPDDPRCQFCYYPFEGIGGRVVRAFLGIERSRLNPHMCNACERFARDHPGGIELVMSLLFADVRGSTTLAEGMSAYDFSRLIDRFYQSVTGVIFDHGGMVDKLVGDEVVAFFVPAFAGQNHAAQTVQAARAVLDVTGHNRPEGPWIPVGVGVHTGVAYVGSVGKEEGTVDITVLGDNVNVAARLTGVAKTGEIILSEATRAAAGLEPTGMESRSLSLKGKGDEVPAWVLRPAAGGHGPA